MGVSSADLAKLSVEEKLDLISELWDSIEASNSTPTLSESQSAELSRRRSEGLSDPTLSVDWSIVRNELRKQHDK
jgi:putative addiction module component (TIGR02574 family)